MGRQPVGVQQHSTRRGWYGSRLTAVIAAIMVLGIVVLTYPFAAQWFNQRAQAAVLSQYTSAIPQEDPHAQEALAQAEAYNAELSGRATYAAGSNVPTMEDTTPQTHRDDVLPYNQQLVADNYGMMARLQIPKIDLDLPVFHGTGHDTLLMGLGHLEGTALPVGGKGMRPLITGHRGLVQAEMFTRLDELAKGDMFTIAVFGRVLAYRVVEKIVVDPDEDQAFLPVPGRDLVTLVTCTPLGLNTHRILVTGERVIPTPQAATDHLRESQPAPGFPWWLLAAVVGLSVVGLYVWRSGVPSRRTVVEDGAAGTRPQASADPPGREGRPGRAGRVAAAPAELPEELAG